jgi:hypothetical protein
MLDVRGLQLGPTLGKRLRTRPQKDHSDGIYIPNDKAVLHLGLKRVFHSLIGLAREQTPFYKKGQKC